MYVQQEVHDGRLQMKQLTKQWYQEVRAVAPSEEDSEYDIEEI